MDFHVTTNSGEFTPEEQAAAAAAREQCKAAAHDALRDFPIWFLAASAEGELVSAEIARSDTRSLSAQAGDRAQLIAFWAWVAQEAARNLAGVAECELSEAATYLMRELLANVVLKDIPDE